MVVRQQTANFIARDLLHKQRFETTAVIIWEIFDADHSEMLLAHQPIVVFVQSFERRVQFPATT